MLEVHNKWTNYGIAPDYSGVNNMESFLKICIGSKCFFVDFFSISNESHDDSDFKIVIKWLEVLKDNLKEVLLKNYE